MNAHGPFIPLIQPAQVFVATSDLAGAYFSGAYNVDVDADLAEVIRTHD